MSGPSKHRRRRRPPSDDLRPEYDFRELGPGVRGKYYKRAIAGPMVIQLVPDSALARVSKVQGAARTRAGRKR